MTASQGKTGASSGRLEATILPYDARRHGDGPWRVVAAVFEEYGFPFSENDYDADLTRPAEHYDGTRGWFAVAEDVDGTVCGCAGVTDEGDGVFELHRLYVLDGHRRDGLGGRLLQWAIDLARSRGARTVVLYSDVAFTDAHRLYRKNGFRNHRFRYAPDPWQSREWGFELSLDR